MTEAFDPTARMGLKPMQTVLLSDFNLPAKARHSLEQMHVPILNIGVRVLSTDEITVRIEEFDGAEWKLRDTTPTIPGETVWHHALKYPDFRVGIENPSETKDQTVSVLIKWMAPADTKDD